ncbi:HAAS signaling domain-containing protein [Bacillus marasmi]|uniref:HAAS signaling domain-containing protein n=1 Tax=Bacillus marasmi TaxID=1926279 RepID=UPI0011CAF905|nr:hypothetical protein [Bacillus marasmi]
MVQSKNEFIAKLRKELTNHQDCESILLEYETHIDEILLETNNKSTEVEIMEVITSRLGTPEEIAKAWRDELTVTPSSMKWLFVAMNILFFGGGSLLTIAHNLYEWNWLSVVWSRLTAVPVIIAIVYMFFWALLGYEIGKGFGHGGRKLLNKTFFAALIPNLCLMILTLLKIIPHSWFEPLLSKSFIILCIVLTMILYPLTWFAYLWGKKASV